ncbi:MAG: hypothetical protein RML36_03545 [Anaerolineae bacterium]|nr:hypothetical protein [Anaerolineae bacterium]MDW8098543.1 hypothetical protein [Anaerolineae bacterium]
MYRVARLILLTFLIAVVIVGCGGRRRAAPTVEPTPTPAATAVQPTATPIPPTPTPVPATATPTSTPVSQALEEGVDLSQAAMALERLGPYRARMETAWKGVMGSDVTTGTLVILGEYVPDDRASRLVWTTTGSETTSEIAKNEMEFIVIGDKQWMRVGDQWLQMTLEKGETIPPILDPRTISQDISSYELVARGEEIHGIKTDHYRFSLDKAQVNALLQSLAAMSVATGEEKSAALELQDQITVEVYEGDVWIAQDGGYLVKYAFEAKWSARPANESEQSWEYQATYEVYDVGAEIRIEPPAGAGGPEISGFQGGQLPMPEGASVQMSTAQMIMLTVPKPLDETRAFYEQALANAGWQPSDGAISMPEMAVLSFSKDGESLTVTLTWDAQSQTTQVMINIGSP